MICPEMSCPLLTKCPEMGWRMSCLWRPTNAVRLGDAKGALALNILKEKNTISVHKMSNRSAGDSYRDLPDRLGLVEGEEGLDGLCFLGTVRCQGRATHRLYRLSLDDRGLLLCLACLVGGGG